MMLALMRTARTEQAFAAMPSDTIRNQFIDVLDRFNITAGTPRDLEVAMHNIWFEIRNRNETVMGRLCALMDKCNMLTICLCAHSKTFRNHFSVEVVLGRSRAVGRQIRELKVSRLGM